jgi:hypothetical protein
MSQHVQPYSADNITIIQISIRCFYTSSHPTEKANHNTIMSCFFNEYSGLGPSISNKEKQQKTKHQLQIYVPKDSNSTGTKNPLKFILYRERPGMMSSHKQPPISNLVSSNHNSLKF